MAEDALTAWRDGAAFRHLATELAPCGDPAALLARTTRLIDDDGWIDALLDPLIEQLATEPMQLLPFSTDRTRRRTALTLFDTPAVRLGAAVVSRDAEPIERTSFVIGGTASVTRYIRAGGARIDRWRAELPDRDLDARTAPPARFVETLAPGDGTTFTQQADEALLVVSMADEIVTLTATLFADSPPLMREYALPDGAFVRAASRDQFASRGTMLLTLLRVQGRRDAAPVFDAASHDPHFHTRWAAMRDWLALDARAALPRLEEMATADPNDDVRGLARTTLAFADARREATACRG